MKIIRRAAIVAACCVALWGCSQENLRTFAKGMDKQFPSNNESTYVPPYAWTRVSNDTSFKTPLIYPEQCLGGMINGKCHGTITPSPKPQLYCYGTYTAYGECVGSINY